MKKNYLLLIILFFCFTIGCSSDPSDIKMASVDTKGDGGSSGSYPSAFDGYKDGSVILGKDLSAIHSVSMMRAAYNTKYPNGDGQYGPSSIRTTHYYVRFLPKNEDEYDSIVTYDLSEIPLYNEIIKGGSSYHDPSIPTDRYTWQYALIPVGNFAPGIVQYEILQEVFIIADGAPGIPGPGSTMNRTFWEALEIVNHKAVTGEDIGPGISWIPSGKIEVYDDLLKKYIPLAGIKVSISRDGEAQTVTTDATGSFKSRRTYQTSVYYKIKWASGIDFEIKDGETQQAYLVSKRSFLPFNVKLDDTNQKQKNIATVYRAAQRAYTKDYLNMVRPVATNFHIGCTERVPIRIAYLHENNEKNYAGLYYTNAGFLYSTKPNVVIYGLDDLTDRIFRTTTHELAHATHHIMFQRQYNWKESNDIIHESWADAVEYYITKLEYLDYGMNIDLYKNIQVGSITTYGTPGYENYVIPSGINKQMWCYTNSLAYSSLVVDLVDNNNQALYYKLKPMSGIGYKAFPNDDVSGFELSKIQTALSASSLADFKSKTKDLNNKYYSTKNTSVQIDTLFNRFEYYWNRRN